MKKKIKLKRKTQTNLLHEASLKNLELLDPRLYCSIVLLEKKL